MTNPKPQKPADCSHYGFPSLPPEDCFCWSEEKCPLWADCVAKAGGVKAIRDYVPPKYNIQTGELLSAGSAVLGNTA